MRTTEMAVNDLTQKNRKNGWLCYIIGYCTHRQRHIFFRGSFYFVSVFGSILVYSRMSTLMLNLLYLLQHWERRT